MSKKTKDNVGVTGSSKIKKKKKKLCDYQSQLFLTVMTGLRRVENIFLQLEDNILDERAFDRIGLSFYRSNYGREIWENNKQFFDRKFVPFFEKLLNKE